MGAAKGVGAVGSEGVSIDARGGIANVSCSNGH